jgi:hypothetical protein
MVPDGAAFAAPAFIFDRLSELDVDGKSRSAVEALAL